MEPCVSGPGEPSAASDARSDACRPVPVALGRCAFRPASQCFLVLSEVGRQRRDTRGRRAPTVRGPTPSGDGRKLASAPTSSLRDDSRPWSRAPHSGRLRDVDARAPRAGAVRRRRPLLSATPPGLGATVGLDRPRSFQASFAGSDRGQRMRNRIDGPRARRARGPSVLARLAIASMPARPSRPRSVSGAQRRRATRATSLRRSHTVADGPTRCARHPVRDARWWPEVQPERRATRRRPRLDCSILGDLRVQIRASRSASSRSSGPSSISSNRPGSSTRRSDPVTLSATSEGRDGEHDDQGLATRCRRSQHVVQERRRRAVDPMHIVDQQHRRSALGEGAMHGFKHSHWLDGCRLS